MVAPLIQHIAVSLASLSIVHALGHALPVIFGSIGLHDVMLPGVAPDRTMLAAPRALRVLLHGLAGWSLRRQLARS